MHVSYQLKTILYLYFIYHYKVFQKRVESTWRRTDCYISEGNHKMKIKLWGQFADQITEENVGCNVSLSNCEVDIYKEDVQLSTTINCVLQVNNFLPYAFEMFDLIYFNNIIFHTCKKHYCYFLK